MAGPIREHPRTRDGNADRRGDATSPAASPTASSSGRPSVGRWRDLTVFDAVVLTVTVLVVFVLGWRALPDSVCAGDSGDLQTACALLGIAHPPGYVGYATVGHLVCRVFFFADPAYVISVACLSCMVGALGAMMWMAVRLGAHALLASAACLLLVEHEFVWKSLIQPEVYAPSLWLLLLAVLWLVHCERRTASAGSAGPAAGEGGSTGPASGEGASSSERCGLEADGAGRAVDGSTRVRGVWGGVCGAAMLFGFAMANRPSLAFMAPGFLLAAMMVCRRRGVRGGRMARLAVGAVAAAAVPIVAVGAMTWYLDTPDRAYNYVRDYERDTGKLPPADVGAVAKWRRVVWLMSAEQYRDLVGTDSGGMSRKLRWVRRQCYLADAPAFVGVIVLVLAGAVSAWRHSAAGVVALLGIVTGGLIFVLQYRVHDQAADLLPVLAAGCVLPVCAVSAVVDRLAGRCSRTWRRLGRFVGIVLCAALAGRELVHADTRYRHDLWDASRFLAELDVASLPAHSTICASWATGRALYYAKYVTYPRDDLTIVSSDDASRWQAYLERASAGPVFYASDQPPPRGFVLRPWRNVWQVVRASDVRALPGASGSVEQARPSGPSEPSVRPDGSTGSAGSPSDLPR